MDGSRSCAVDKTVCGSCKHLLAEKDKTIKDLERSLLSHKTKVESLQDEVKNLKGSLENGVQEKAALEQKLKELSDERSDNTEDAGEKDKILESLQDQLLSLEEEKKNLNEKIHDFEHETAGLSRIFGMQQEKFEHEMKNKERKSKALEKERERVEDELKTSRNALAKMKVETEAGKKLIENLKSSLLKKDEEVLNVSDLHDKSKERVKELGKQLTEAEEILNTELSKNKLLEEDISSYMEDIEALSEENRRLKMENNQLGVGQMDLTEEKCLVENELQRSKNRVESLQNEVEDNKKGIVELDEYNARLKQEIDDTEVELRMSKQNGMELLLDIEKLKKEIVLVIDQKHALESKTSLVQEEIKNVEDLRKKLEQDLFKSRKCLEETEESLQIRIIEKEKLAKEVSALEEVIDNLKNKNRRQNECLESMQENLESVAVEKEKLAEEVQALEHAINNLKNKIKQQNKCFEETKRELDSVMTIKQQLLLEVEKLEDVNKDLKMKISTLSKDVENMHDVCATKAKKLEDMERIVNEKARINLSLEKKEKELQSMIDELQSINGIYANELKNAKDDLGNLRTENVKMNDNYEKAKVELEKCLIELGEKHEMYMKSKAQFEKQVEELTRFRIHNGEINDELRHRNDEITLLAMEKDKLGRELESAQKLIERNSSKQSLLNKEIESMKKQLEKYKGSEKEALDKLSEAKEKYETVLRQLDNEKDEKNDLENALKYSQEKSERWRKLSFEMKDERNRLQMQIAELDRDLNEKHSNLAEEKSSLEKETETLRNVIKRLKSNEENLRGKIEELRDEVDKVSDVSCEQEMEIRKLSWEKERTSENLMKLKGFAEENVALQNECKEKNCENTSLKNDVDALQDKATNVRDENERLQKELKVLQDQLDVTQAHAHEAAQECKQLKNDCATLQDNHAEIMEEKERLFSENCRLKEKKNSITQERNTLQDMVESLDKCHSEKNDALYRENALLKNELASRRSALGRHEEKELRLLSEIQELNEKFEKSAEEREEINGLIKKADAENIRLRKKVADLAKLVEQIEQERDARVNLQTELHGKEQVLNQFKESKKKLDDLVTALNHEHNQLKNELRNKEREVKDLSNDLESERSDKLKFKDEIKKLEEELQRNQSRERKYVEEMQSEKEKNEQLGLVFTEIKNERDDLKETLRRNDDEFHKKIEDIENKKYELLAEIERLQNDKGLAKICKENLDAKIQNLEKEMGLLARMKTQLAEKLKRKDEQLLDLAKETKILKEENKRLQEHVENIDQLLSLQSTAALDQASGMEKEIQALRDTLAQLRTTGDKNRTEIDELKSKLTNEKDSRMSTEVKLNDIQLQRERLEGQNDNLVSNCARLEKLVEKGVQLKVEKEEKERLLEGERQKNRIIEEKLVGKSRELTEKDRVVENLKEQISNYKQKIEKLSISKEGLVASVEELTKINDEGLKEFQWTREKNELLLLEKKRLAELVAFQKVEMGDLKKESERIKTDLQLKVQEAENDKIQLQGDVKVKEENLQRLAEKNQELQNNLKDTKEEVDDLENENEDLLAEVHQLKEVNKKAKEVVCTLQTEHNVFQEEQREKQNKWNEEKEKFALEVFKLETDMTKLNERLIQANERNEKQRELEKMLRLEIDELSDGYVELEEEVQHRNEESLSLKEKIQNLSQYIEELELARDTACLLKEKRHHELLKSDKNVQRLEKLLKEKQKTNKKLQKDLDSILEKEKFLELQISSEKELSGQRLKEIQDLQNSQRKADEQLWKAKRDIEKLETEIETWRVSSNSMKVRIETLEEELNKSVSDNEILSRLSEESKKLSEATDEEILELRADFSEKTAYFEKIIEEINNQKSDLRQKLNNVEKVLDKRVAESTTLKDLLGDMNNKYENTLLVTTLLHNDIQKKDERIVNLEVRKKQVTNLLADLDLKIAEIQVQAVRLETDNENLRHEISRVTASERTLRQTMERERRTFSEKREKDAREIQHLKDTKDHFAEHFVEAKSEIEDKNNELVKLQADHAKLICDNNFVSNRKKCLENELWDMKSREEKLKQTLHIEKDTTLNQKSEIERLLKECESLKSKCLNIAEELKGSEKKLIQAMTMNEKLESCLEERDAEILKICQNFENEQNKSAQLEESLSVLISQNEKIVQKKNEEILSLTATNGKLKNEIDEVKSELNQQKSRNVAIELENKGLKEKLELKQKHLDDLQVSYQSTINSKYSLEEEKKGLLRSVKATSRDLEKLEIQKQQLLTEKEDLNCALRAKEKEFEDRFNALQEAHQKLDEEIFDHKASFENALIENSNLRQKVNDGAAQLRETTNALGEIRQKLDAQEKENNTIKLALQKTSFERNVLAEVNSRVSNAIENLMCVSSSTLGHNGNIDTRSVKDVACVSYETQHGRNNPLKYDKKTTEDHREAEYSCESKQAFAMKSFELQNSFLQIENEVRTLRALVSDKENDVTRLEVSIDLLQNEIDAQFSQLSSYMSKFEGECKQKNEALETVKKLLGDLEELKKEKTSFAAESQEKVMHLHRKLLANELVICSLQGINVQLEGNVQEMKKLNEEKTKEIKSLENMEITRISELQAGDKILEETFSHILDLEEVLNVREVKKDSTNGFSDENNRLNRYEELSCALRHRLEQILENIQSQMAKAKMLQKNLTNAQSQSSVYYAELQAAESGKQDLKEKCSQFEQQLSLATYNYEETLCKVVELSESLKTTEDEMEKTRVCHEEENLKISQELQKMQRELVLACEKFNNSNAKCRSLEQKIGVKEKRIADMEASLKVLSANERMHQIRIAELEATAEILLNTNNELEYTAKVYEEKISSLQCSLQEEKAGRNEDIAERDSLIRQLKMKYENSEQQILRCKELLRKAENVTKNLEEELKSLQCQSRENELLSKAEIEDSKSKILRFQQSILNLEEVIARLENDMCALAKTNDDLLKNISTIEKENKDYRNILRQNEQQKEVQIKIFSKMFDAALHEEAGNDVNDQNKKLERVTEVIKELYSCKKNLTKEKNDALENVLKLEKEIEDIRRLLQTKCEDNQLLKQDNSKLSDLMKSLEDDLERSEVKCKQLNSTIQELQESVETLKANENQQQYQYQVLEKENDDLESEAVYIEEGMEKLAEELNESIHLLHDVHPDTTSGDLDDSGVSMMSNRDPLDSALFSSRFDKHNLVATDYQLEQETVHGSKKMHHLKTAVDTCVHIMSKVGPTLNEKDRLFSTKEQKLLGEIRVLKQTSVQNEDLLSSLEKEVERLEFSQKSLQQTYQEKDEKIAESQRKLEHSMAITNEKELSITILNESVKECRKRQEFLEKELDATKEANEKLGKEKLQNSTAIQDYEKAFEELRQKSFESDAENEKRTDRLGLKINQLENQVLEKEQANLDLQNLCSTLRSTVDQLNKQTKENCVTITWYKDQVEELEKQHYVSTKLAEDLAQELGKCKETIKLLETMYLETQESSKDVKNKLHKANIDLEESRREVTQFKEENVRLKLERDSLTDEAKVNRAVLKERKSTIEHISSTIREKDELLRKNEAKLKLVEEFLQEINKCKDRLETDIDDLKKQNSRVRKDHELLKGENKDLLVNVKTKEEEIMEKNNVISELNRKKNEIEKEYLTKDAAHKEAVDELRMSLAEAKRIKNVVEGLTGLFDADTALLMRAETECPEEVDMRDLLSAISKNISNLSLVCQKTLVERENLEKNLEEQRSLLENERSEKSALEREKKHLNEKISASSKNLTEVKRSLEKLEQDLDYARNGLNLEKRRNAELVDINLSLQKQIEHLESDVSTISTNAESLKIERNNLKESLLRAQNQVANMYSKCERVDVLSEELRNTKEMIDELNDLQKLTMAAKDDVEMEMESTRKRLTDLEDSLTERTKVLNDTQTTLTLERDRIVTLTKLARIKEHDLENARMALKFKEELAKQMKEASDTTKEELVKVMEQLTTLQEKKETLSNEKVCLWKDCSILKDQVEQLQQEKKVLEMELDNEKTRASMDLEKLQTQQLTISNLENEVQQTNDKYEKLQDEAIEKEKKLQLECEKLLEKSHAQNKNLEITLLHLRDELSLSESLREELEHRLAGNELAVSNLQDQNFELQAEIETCQDTIKHLNEQENCLDNENKYLKESVENVEDENKRLENCYDKAKEQLETAKTNLTRKERENDVLQKKILSGKEIICTLRNVALKSKSGMNDLKCKVLENAKKLEKASKELEQERNNVSKLLEDKTNLEELCRVCKSSETSLREDLEDAKLQMNNIRSENINLKKVNTTLHCKIQENENSINDLKSCLQTTTAQKMESGSKLMEARRDLDSANEDLYRVRSQVVTICAATRSMHDKYHAADSQRRNIDSDKEEKHVETSPSSVEALGNPWCSVAVNSVFEELSILEMEMTQVDSLLKHLLEIETTLNNKIKALNLENGQLREKDEKQEEKIKTLQEKQNYLQHNNDQLAIENKDLVRLCERLKEEKKRVEELLSNECKTTMEISNELSTMKDEKQRLFETNNELEVCFDHSLKENDDLKTKQVELQKEMEAMCEKVRTLERSHIKLSQEKIEIDEKALERKEQILALKRDLKASVEFSGLLEKRYTKENENNTSLRLRVETLDNQIIVLENTLKTSLSQIEEMNTKVVLMNKEICQTGVALHEKEKEIARLCEEKKVIDKKLEESNAQLENYKTTHEAVVKSKMKAEEKLEKTELLLTKSEMLLQTERESTRNLTTETENIQQELQSIIMKHQERIDELMLEVSSVIAKEESTEQILDSARDTIKELEDNLNQEALKLQQSEEKRKKITDEFNYVQDNYTSTKAQLEQMHKENEELYEEKRALEESIENVNRKITLQSQEKEEKLTEIRNLEVQFATEKKAKKDLQSEISRLEENLDLMKHQISDNKEQFDCVVENKNKEIAEMTRTFEDEINKMEELQSSLNTAQSEIKEIQQVNKNTCQVVFALCQSMVNNLKSTHLEKSYDGNLFTTTFDVESVTDPSQLINVIRASHVVMQEHINHLDAQISESNQRLTETEKQNGSLLIEKIQLEDELERVQEDRERVQEDRERVQEDRDSLAKTMESCQHVIKSKSKNIRDLQDEINEFRHREKFLEETIEGKEEEYLALHSEMEVIEKKRTSVEDEVGRLQLKLGDTIIELTNTKTTNEVLENKNSELVLANASLLHDQASLQNKLKTSENSLSSTVKESKELLGTLSRNENQLSNLEMMKRELEREKIEAQKHLEVTESELTLVREMLDKVQRQKNDLENQMINLNEIIKQVEKENKELQQTTLRTHADNSHLQRQLECEKNEKSSKITNLQSQLKEAVTSLKRQQHELSQVQSEKDVVHSQLREAEKELKVLMEDNADLNQKMYQNKMNFSNADKDELLATKCQVSKLRNKEVILSQENRYLAEQLREKSDELRQLKAKEEEFTKEMEKNREKMRKYLDERDKWEQEVKSVISEIGDEKNSESTMHGTNVNNLNHNKLNNNARNMNAF